MSFIIVTAVESEELKNPTYHLEYPMRHLLVLTIFAAFTLTLTAAALAENYPPEIKPLIIKEMRGEQLNAAEKAALNGYFDNAGLRYNHGTDEVWGPDGFYIARDQQSGGQPFNWINISATGTELWPGQTQDDTWSDPIPLPFTFPFYQGAYNSIYISANMILKFTTAYVSYSNPIPSTSYPSRIDPWCYDMYHESYSRYYYQGFGDSLFVFTFLNSVYYTTAGRNPAYGKDLQILIWRDGTIKFQYDSLRTILANSPYTSGVDDSCGIFGLSCGNNFSQGLAITFSPVSGLILGDGRVNPSSGQANVNFEYAVFYRNSDNRAPTIARVYIDNAPRNMTIPGGNYQAGVTLTYSTQLDTGLHTFFFVATDGVDTTRLPETGSYQGPTVIETAYEWEIIPYEWINISAVGVHSGCTGDDQTVGPFPLGFNFPSFQGSGPFQQIYICSNGWLSFTSTVANFINDPIPTPAEPNNLIAVFWDDLYPPGGGNIYYYQDTQNHRWVVQYDHVEYLVATGTVTCQAIIYENGWIEYQYNELGTLNSSTIGVENNDGMIGLQLFYNGAGPFMPANQTGLRLFPPGTGSCLNVTLTPVNPPIRIPAGGGNFSYQAMVENLSDSAVNFDAWTEVILPNGMVYGPLINRNVTIPARWTIMRTLNQYVPMAAPPGLYTYVGNVGNFPDTILASDDFPFQKLAGDAAPNHNLGWAVYGWDDETAAANIPAEYELNAAVPNPFNPSTSIGFALPEPAKVALTVYDISGRQVAVLVDEFLPPGHHQAVFDGSGLASGIYLFRLTAGSFTAAGKMVLVK